MPTSVIDVDETTFQRDVLDASRELPVVVDFWAAWCGPCRTLGPMLEQAVEARAGDVVLAKVDVDANPRLAQAFRVQGIPAVKAFRDGGVVDEFVGAQPRPAIEAFLDRIAPSPADRAAARAADLADVDPAAAAEAYEEALRLEPGHRDAAVGLAELRLADDPEAALELVRPHRPHPAAEAVAARAELAAAGVGDVDELRARAASDGDADAHLALGRALAADGRHEEAVEHLLLAVRAGGETREQARAQLVSLFTALGDDHEVVRSSRPKLASALF